MPGLFWLLQGSMPRGLPAGCMTFVRGTDELLVLAGLGPALSTNAINVLLGEANFWVPGTIAEQVLAIEVPPNT